MTRCMRNVVNLKSSAYNQTGQNYFEQLAAYNSMSSHLRRILLAKSTIDTRNKNYSLKKSRRCKVQGKDNKRTYLHREVTDDVIEKLAYDTRHHPMDVLRMNFNLKHPLDCCNNLHCHQSKICNHTYYEENNQTDHRQRLMSKNERTISPVTSRSARHKKLVLNFVGEKELKSVHQVPHTIDLSTCYSQWSASQSYDDLNCDDKTVDQYIGSKQCSSKKEEKKYIKFVYDITKEIMQKGLYTDKELQDVFKKHIEQHKGILNMNKMLYEIYQLKISLNIVDSDTDDELEDLIHAQKLLSVSEIRPPTPPKVLDENKVMEKLESYQKMIEVENRPSNATGKSVTIVDANPELFITERDVLISLIEVGIDPKQAQHICKNLLQRSKDTALAGMMQVHAEVSRLGDANLDLEVNNLKTLQDNNVSISPEVKTTENIHNAIVDYSAKSSITKQEASPSLSNNIAVQDETIEIEKNMESQSTAKNDDEMKNDKVES